MNDYQEYESYGSYLGRVFAIIIAVALLVLAIWFVVRLADNKNDTIGDTETVSTVVSSDSTSSDSTSNDSSSTTSTDDVNEPSASDESSNSSDVAVADTSESTTTEDGSEGHVLSTNTDDLPNTGANASLLIVAPILTFVASHVVLKFREQ